MPSNFLAKPPKRVSFIACLTRREQIAILGVQHEEEAVEHDQGSIADLRQVNLIKFLRALGIAYEKGAGESREHVAKYNCR